MAFVYADMAVTLWLGNDCAAYVQNELKDLQNDKHLNLSAGAQTRKAADFLHGFLQ